MGNESFSTRRDERNVEDKITELFGLCSNDPRNWENLVQEYVGALAICLYANNWNRELRLSTEVMDGISKRKLCLWIDMYFETDDEEISTE